MGFNLIKAHYKNPRRFDRHNGQRIPFLSAMSMLGAKDNESHSYLEMAYALAQYGAAPEQDMAELWRRIIFTVLISNTDDHLRNHGFIYERYRGWRLSPVYDLNPTPLEVKPHVLTTAIDFDDTRVSLETALAVAKDFRLSSDKAREILKEVGTAMKLWRHVAANLGLSSRECERMASAFEQAEGLWRQIYTPDLSKCLFLMFTSTADGIGDSLYRGVSPSQRRGSSRKVR